MPKIRAFMFGPEEQVELASLRDYAHAHVVDTGTILRMASGAHPAVGEIPTYRRELACCPAEPDYVVRMVLSIEDQPGGKFLHLSVSVWSPTMEEDDMLPNPSLVELLMAFFDFPYPLNDSKIWIEGGKAINVVQPLVEEIAGA